MTHLRDAPLMRWVRYSLTYPERYSHLTLPMGGNTTAVMVRCLVACNILVHFKPGLGLKLKTLLRKCGHAWLCLVALNAFGEPSRRQLSRTLSHTSSTQEFELGRQSSLEKLRGRQRCSRRRSRCTTLF